MQVLVTGGSGFVGANVVRRLLARGDRVRCLVRGTSPGVALDGLPIERVVGSLTDVEGLKRALDGVEGVYHVAGLYDPGPGGEARMREVHVDATVALTSAAKAAGVRRIVLTSSSITVGYGPRTSPGDERTPLDPEIYGRTGPLRTYYETKAEAERLAATSPVPTVVVNPDYVLGAWDLKPTSGAAIVRMAKHPVPFYPRGGKCFVDADDCAEAHLLAMDRGEPGERYLLGVHNASYREFLGLVAGVVGRRPPVLPIPRRATRLAGAVLGLTPRTAPVGRLLAAMQEDRYRSGARALALGMPVTPLEASIEKAYRWFVDHGYC